jgi:hypothetical protein
MILENKVQGPMECEYVVLVLQNSETSLFGT